MNKLNIYKPQIPNKIPYSLYRGGTSQGPLFMRTVLPLDPINRDKTILQLMGSPHEMQIDGIGGINALKNKICIVGLSSRKNVDIDYLLCQVYAKKSIVDTSIDCGNMLAAVSAFAIENGLVKITHPETMVRIFSENTGVYIESIVQTPEGKISYEGNTKMDGVEDLGSPIKISFLNPSGTTTGNVLPTGNVVDIIDNICVSCIDVSMPMVIVEAWAFDKTGYETKDELDNDKIFMNNLENIRKAAAFKMGLGDVTGKAMPKICMIAKPINGGHIAARYMIAPFDYDCHPSFAVTGAMCLAASAYIDGTLSHKILSNYKNKKSQSNEYNVIIEHPTGSIDASVQLSQSGLEISKVSYTRTARKISVGEVFIPGKPSEEIMKLLNLQIRIKEHLATKSKYKKAITMLFSEERFDAVIELTNLVKNKRFKDADIFVSKLKNYK